MNTVQQPTIAPTTPTMMEKPALDSPTAQDTEAGQTLEYSDRVLLGQRSYAETIVLCFANLIPPLGVAWVLSCLLLQLNSVYMLTLRNVMQTLD